MTVSTAYAQKKADKSSDMEFEPENMASTPPSKTLERAIKLYDKKDFYSASIELQKVLDGQSGDDAQNKQRAEFFMVKTLYQMGYYAAAAGRLNQLVSQGPTHIYFTAAAKWMIAIYHVTANPPLGDALFAYRGTNVLDDPTLASVRDEFAYYFGRELGRRDVAKQEAIAALEQVGPSSTFAAKARIEIDRIKTPPAERAALEAKLKAQASPAYARYAASRPNVNVPIDVVDAILIPTACHEAGDLTPVARKVIAEAQSTIAKLRAVDDNTELATFVLQMRKAAPQPGSDVVLAMLVDARTDEFLSWAAELEVEFKALQKADKAWETTPIAGEVLQDLTVMQSLAQADLGKVARDRLDKLDAHLQTLSAALPANLRVDMPRELCGSAAVTIAMRAQNGADQPQTVKPHSGCAGCSTHDAQWSGAALLALLLLRRRAARR
jgi:hypothetical protein